MKVGFRLDCRWCGMESTDSSVCTWCHRAMSPSLPPATPPAVLDPAKRDPAIRYLLSAVIILFLAVGVLGVIVLQQSPGQGPASVPPVASHVVTPILTRDTGTVSKLATPMSLASPRAAENFAPMRVTSVPVGTVTNYALRLMPEDARAFFTSLTAPR